MPADIEVKAMIEHILDDDSATEVICDVGRYSAKLDAFWISYPDPEDGTHVIMDYVDRDELKFMAPKQEGASE